MRRARLITTGLAAAAALAISPAGAAAAGGTFTDDTVPDFGAGTPGADAWVVEAGSVDGDGSVRLKPIGDALNFDGMALPPAWTATSWTTGTGTAAVSDGALRVDGMRVNASPTYAAPRTLEFRATFGATANQHVGFGTDFNNPPWAMFSTGNGSDLPAAFYARTTGATPESTPITDVPAGPHLYRIEWGAGEAKFYVDGALKATHAPTQAGPMRPVISDFLADGSPVKVDWLGMSPGPATAAFESRVHDAGSAKAVWGTLTGTGIGVAYATRSGTTKTPDATWSAYEPLGDGGAIQSPPGRYIQYRATLTASAGGADTARLDKVDVTYDIDETAPGAAIGGVTVSGTSATATFSSPATDVARFECSLDGGAFAACTSPKQLTGLAAGGHAIAVRAVDRAGNTGAAVSQSFAIAAPAGGGGTPPPAGGGGTTPPPSGGAADRRAPVVRVTRRSVRVTRRGALALRLTCPPRETWCKVDLQLRRGGIVVASKRVKIAGGAKRTVTLRLAKEARRALADRRRLKVTAKVAARDAAGNTATTSRKLTLLAPRP